MPGNNEVLYLGGLPKEIKCSVCQIPRDPEQHYSVNALKQYQVFARKKNRVAQWKASGKAENEPKLLIKCKDCTGQQSGALTCQLCDVKKGLTAFSKVQRKNPDGAKCLSCMHATQLVLPTSAEDGTIENGLLPSDGEDNGDDQPIDVRSMKYHDYFVKNGAGQFFSTFQDDVSSISNRWENRSTSGSANSGNGDPTAVKLSALDAGLRDMDIDKDKGTTITSLIEPRQVTESDSSDEDSDESNKTIRGNFKTSVETSGKSKAVFNTKDLGSGSSPPSRSKIPAHSSAYDDSSDEDDGNDYQFTRRAGDKHVVNIYSNVITTSKAPETQKLTSKSGFSVNGIPSESASNVYASGVAYRTTGSMGLTSESKDQNPSKPDKKHRTKYIAASGFKTKTNNYTRSKNFGRVRPTNMLAADIKHSLVYQKQDIDGINCAKPPEEISSDEE